MSPCPHAPGSASRLTKNKPRLPVGVGQKSSAAELTGSPRLVGAPQGALLFARLATQMSSPPNPPARFDARYRLRPSDDWIGQPSSEIVFSSPLFPAISSIFCGAPQAPNPAADATAASTRETTPTTTMRLERFIRPAPFRARPRGVR